MSMILKVFTQPACPKCPAAKKTVAQVEDKFTVEYYDIKTEDGLGEALQYDVMSTPSLVVLHGSKIIGEWRGEAPKAEELLNLLK